MGAVQSGFMSWETFYYNMNQREAYPAGWTIEEERAAIAKDEQEKIIKLDYRDWETDRKSTRLNSSHSAKSRMPSSA